MDSSKQRQEFLSTKQLAARLDISRRQVSLLSEIGLPRVGKGQGVKYEWHAALQFFISHRIDVDRKLRPKADASSELVQWELRRIACDTEKRELQLAKLRNEVVSANEVQDVASRAFSNVRNRVLALPSSTAPRLVNMTVAEIAECLNERICEALTSLSTDIFNEQLPPTPV